MLEPITVANEACGLATVSPIQSLEAQVPAAAAVVLAYDRVLGFCLGLHTFSWSLATRKLARLSDAPETGFLYAFQLPAERVSSSVKVSDDGRDPERHFTAYLLEGDQVHSDAPELWARVRIKPHPRLWSATFRHAFTLGLAADLAIIVKRDKALHEQHSRNAFGDPRLAGRGGAMQSAILDDSLSTPSQAQPAAAHDPLTSAWRS